MKKYYLHDGNQSGPFSADELQKKGITPDTLVWYDGLTEWTNAGSVEELATLFTKPPEFKATTPPPLKTSTQEHARKKSNTSLIVGITVLAVIIIIGMMMSNNPNSIPAFQVDINSPKPVVITSRSDGEKSGLFNARLTVYATIQNQGGEGNVVVTFNVTQGKKKFDRSKVIFLAANQSKDIEVTFEEVTYIDGEITYQIVTAAQ